MTIKQALLDFDQAAVYTIHGFCQRLVQENAFETGAAFDVDLVTDTNDIKDLIIKDFIRSRYYFGQEDQIYRGLFPDFKVLKDIVEKCLGSHELIIHPDPGIRVEDFIAFCDPIQKRYQDLAHEFDQNQEQI